MILMGSQSGKAREKKRKTKPKGEQKEWGKEMKKGMWNEERKLAF